MTKRFDLFFSLLTFFALQPAKAQFSDGENSVVQLVLKQ